MRTAHNVVGEIVTVSELSPKTVCKEKSIENRVEAGRTPEFNKKWLQDGGGRILSQ